MSKISAEELLDGFDRVEARHEFEARLKEGKPLVVKLGLDPTTPDLHIGHAVVLRKLQQFVQNGDDVTLIIGDTTASIGDPSGRNSMRPPLTQEQINANMMTYRDQAGTVLDMSRVRLRYNSEWLAALQLSDMLKLMSQVTVAQLLARNDFSERYASNTPISLHEFLYPVAQSYDSVAIKSDIELGGNDQLFNFLMARQFQSHAGLREQVCMTVPLLEGLDGVKKMSKSTGNYVGLTESAQSMFGKLMSIPDELIARYARLAAFCSETESLQLAQALGNGSAHPMEEKKKLAIRIVTRYHDATAAKAAADFFERTVQRKQVPTEDLPELTLERGHKVTDVLIAAGFAESKRAAERLISGNGVKVDGILVDDPKAAWPAGEPAVLSVGSRKFVRVLQA